MKQLTEYLNNKLNISFKNKINMNIKLLKFLLIGISSSLVILSACQKDDEPPIEYTITYHNVGSKNAISNPTTYTSVTANISLAIPIDSTNYTFGGWFTNSSCTDTISTPAITQNSTGNKDFYAKWLANDFTITYYNIGTKNATSNPSTYTVETADISLAIPSDSTNYTFVGWFTNSSFTDTISTPAIAQSSTGNKEFYAKWLANEFNITYHNVGTLNPISNPISYTIESADITLSEPRDSIGYTFEGWYTNIECTNSISTPAIATGSSGNMDFYAKWVGTFTDTRDGKTYKWVKIGDQIWMAENLAYLPSVDDNSTFSSKYEPSYGVYGYDGNNVDVAKAYTQEIDGKTVNMYETYGVLYNGYAVKQANICPDGWHIPTDEEWSELIDYLAANGHSGAEGNALKATNGWFDGGEGTDDFGFAALPSGFRTYLGGTYENAGFSGCWWSSTETATGDIMSRYVNKVETEVVRIHYTKLLGYSVRCIRD